MQLFNIMDVLDSRNWEAKDATHLGDPVTADQPGYFMTWGVFATQHVILAHY